MLSWIARSFLILVLWGGMFKASPAQPAYARTLVVTNANASGSGSLRQAIVDAASGDTITFDSSLAGATIPLHGLVIVSSGRTLTIDGSGLSPQVVLSGEGVSQIMQLSAITDVTLVNLSLTKGFSNGGAIEVADSSNLTIKNCAFYQNHSTSSGGAIYFGGTGTLTIIDSTFYQNEAVGSGGAVQISASGPHVITNSTFFDNTAGGDGGAIYGSNVTITGSTLSRNIAGWDGGAIVIPGGDFKIQSTTINQNQANSEGGAIALEGNAFGMIVNSTVTRNQANDSGGGISTSGDIAIEILNSTFAGNNAPMGSEVSGIGVAEIDLFNTILACSPGNASCIEEMGIVSVFGPNSIIGTGTLASFGLAELADNGGPTQTMALLPASPLIDAGDNSVCANSLVNNLDQRGVTRPQGSYCDIGAYESLNSAMVTKVEDTDDEKCDSDCSLREAIKVVAPGGTVSFNNSLAGQTIHLVSELVIDKNLIIDGSTLATPITISGDTDNDGTGNVRVFTVNRDVDAALIHLQIVKGKHTYGGGVFNVGTLTITNSTFSDNVANLDGGGIYNGHMLTVANSTFANNSAFQFGGGVSSTSPTAVITVENSVFSNNYAFVDGGAIRGGGSLTVAKSVFYDNSAQSGGAILHLGTLSVEDSTFTNNSASFGGAIDTSGALTTGMITNSTFSSNSAISGGGITNSGELTITNSTFSNNSASYGGAIRNYTYFSLTIKNSTLSNNSATTSGGGIYNQSWGTLHYGNTIIANSTSGGECVNFGTLGLNVNNFVEDGSCSAALQGDPRLGPLAANGGLTQTMALDKDSLAIEAGNDANCPATDQRGVARPQGMHCDIGAYEYQDVNTGAPMVLSITRTSPSPTSASSVDFTVTFSELVTGVETGDFTLHTIGQIASATISSVTGSGATYTVSVNTGIKNGTLRLDMPGTATVNDLAGNALVGLPFDTGQAYTVFKTNGADTTGVFRPSNGLLYLKHQNVSGFADVEINYGIGGDYPVVGDWDGDGTVTIGVYRNGQFYLRNTNTIGFADVIFPFGMPGDQPVAGDWDGDGIDTIGVYRNGTFFLRNTNDAGAPQMIFGLGIPGDVGIAGDWDGDGKDSTGVFRPSNGLLYLKHKNETGFADIEINYGIGGDKPVTGDWNNDGTDTIGVYRNGQFYLRNSNTIGFADIVFALGIPGDHPIAGNWDGLP